METGRPTAIERLLNTEEAAQLLGIKTWTLRAWVHERRVPYIKLGRLVRFSEKRLARWIEEQAIEPSNGHEHY